jgi:hypothetical protein
MSNNRQSQPIKEGHMSKGGHNVLKPTDVRPPAPQGSGGPSNKSQGQGPSSNTGPCGNKP